MSELRSGWEVVCPDGIVRHYPYTNLGDAECDAVVYSENGCSSAYPEPSPLELAQPPCPEGKHSVRPTVFVRPPERGEA